MIRIGVNGYGVIGRRIADAIRLQPDMEVTGVVKVKADYKATLALSKGYDLYSAEKSGKDSFKEKGLAISGSLTDLVPKVDMMIDASPGDVGAANKSIYEKFHKPAIFQGGEDHGVASISFVAQCNYDKAKGHSSTRVVSCNTTALCRVLGSIDESMGISRGRVVLARRAADPDEPSKGPIDAVVLDPVNIPSHHGPDVNTVLPGIKITTMAMKVPTTHMHLHSVILTLEDPDASKETITQKLEDTTRVLLVNGKDGLKSTAHLVDLGRELGRPRGDLYEAIIWKDSICVDEKEASFFMAVHQEAIVIPENIDAIRAMLGSESKDDSIAMTNNALGIDK